MAIAAILLALVTNITGVVTLARESLPFYFISDNTGLGWRVSKTAECNARIGDTIEASGIKESSMKSRLEATRIALAGKDRVSREALPLKKASIDEIFKSVMPFGNTKWYAVRLSTEGLVRDINRRQNSTQLLIGEGDRNLQVEIPVSLEEALPKNLVAGAMLRITGNLAWTSIENFEEGTFGRIENVEIIPASMDDVEVIKVAPFWTAQRLSTLGISLAILLLASFAWAISLRRMVMHRTRQLAESIRLRETAKIEADAARRERLRLAADLHDGFQQYLAAAYFRMKAAKNLLMKDAAKSLEQLEKAQDALKHTQNGLRSTLWAMNEESEGPESLIGLFNFAARRMDHWEGKVEIRGIGEEVSIARNYCGSLLLVLQEAVGNAIRHGKAGHVKIEVDFRTAKSVTISVRDDGCGFDIQSVNSSEGHYGLSGMQRRIAELGGKLDIKSVIGRGTELIFTIPVG